MSYPHTLNQRFECIRRLLDSAEQTLMAAGTDANGVTRNGRYVVALSNLEQLTDMAKMAERDLAAALLRNPQAKSETILHGYVEQHSI
jgi:hypothetical protein